MIASHIHEQKISNMSPRFSILANGDMEVIDTPTWLCMEIALGNAVLMRLSCSARRRGFRAGRVMVMVFGDFLDTVEPL